MNPYYSGPKSDHFDGERFFFPGVDSDRSRAALLRWQMGAFSRPAWPKSYPSPFQDKPPARLDGDAMRIVPIGHASHLIQTAGLNILVDPVWSKRASPVQWAGPARVNAPGIALEDLPPLDLILLTHNHYDHMDAPTLVALAKARPCRILTPLGNDAILRAFSTPIAAEAFDWGAAVPIGSGVTVHFEPAQHWSARGVRDRRMALWASFLIETPGGAIYHVGDTGYTDDRIFRAVRDKHGAPRLAILPIGAYEPRWFMKGQHVDPDEAVRIFQAVGASWALGHHWGTFRLTDEAIDDPPKRLAAALAREGIPPDRFVTRRPGEVFDVPA